MNDASSRPNYVHSVLEGHVDVKKYFRADDGLSRYSFAGSFVNSGYVRFGAGNIVVEWVLKCGARSVYFEFDNCGAMVDAKEFHSGKIISNSLLNRSDLLSDLDSWCYKDDFLNIIPWLSNPVAQEKRRSIGEFDSTNESMQFVLDLVKAGADFVLYHKGCKWQDTISEIVIVCCCEDSRLKLREVINGYYTMMILNDLPFVLPVGIYGMAVCLD